MEAMSLLVGAGAADTAGDAAGVWDFAGVCAEMAAEKSRVRTMRMVRRFGMDGSLEFVFCTENEWGGGLVNSFVLTARKTIGCKSRKIPDAEWKFRLNGAWLCL